jgi:hypothetical protein
MCDPADKVPAFCVSAQALAPPGKVVLKFALPFRVHRAMLVVQPVNAVCAFNQPTLVVQPVNAVCAFNQPTLVVRPINPGRVCSRKRWGTQPELTFLGQVGDARQANVNERGGGLDPS